MRDLQETENVFESVIHRRIEGVNVEKVLQFQFQEPVYIEVNIIILESRNKRLCMPRLAKEL